MMMAEGNPLGWSCLVLAQWQVWLLGGMVSLLALMIFVVLPAWIALKWLCHRAAVRQAEREAHEARFMPDGRPYPPSGEGICQHCLKAFDKVYYLPSGECLCPDCFRRLGR